MMRVQKILSNSGVCSRRKAEELIEQGKVSVNGKVISLGDKASVNDKIKVSGKLIRIERKVYVIFHKPVGCVTALTDNKYKTVMDFINIKERVFPVGRLDFNTSGLLFLTNDGDFAQSVAHPSNEVKKTYVATVSKDVKKSDLIKLEKGVVVDGKRTFPARAKLLSSNTVQLTIHEGRNRIVRKMLNSLGYRVSKLHRSKIGKFSLPSIEPGSFKISFSEPII